MSANICHGSCRNRTRISGKLPAVVDVGEGAKVAIARIGSGGISGPVAARHGWNGLAGRFRLIR